jgi:hypothetical protein
VYAYRKSLIASGKERKGWTSERDSEHAQSTHAARPEHTRQHATEGESSISTARTVEA